MTMQGGLEDFDRWYSVSILRTYFDEVHTIKQLEIALNDDKTDATAKVQVIWEASHWSSPAPTSAAADGCGPNLGGTPLADEWPAGDRELHRRPP